MCMDALTPHRLSPSAEIIDYIYYNTESGSKLRLYIAQSLAHMILSKDGSGRRYDEVGMGHYERESGARDGCIG
jgi:hypothetical protein